MVDAVPTLTEVDKWFDAKVIPSRTTWSGLSYNRVVKSPQRWVTGNESDPNGLCGDTTSYVIDAFEKAYPKADPTADGYMLGVILWEGIALNHIANVMLPQPAAFKQSFEYKGGVVVLKSPAGGKLGERVSGPPRSQTRILGGKELLGLHVYDLYYKTRTTVDSWWDDRDSKGGLVTVGMIHEFT